VDVYIVWPGADTAALASKLGAMTTSNLKLTMMDNRGTKVWPGGAPETFCSDLYRCRFLSQAGIAAGEVVELLGKIAGAGLDFSKTENLHNYDGQRGYTLAQGE